MIVHALVLQLDHLCSCEGERPGLGGCCELRQKEDGIDIPELRGRDAE